MFTCQNHLKLSLKNTQLFKFPSHSEYTGHLIWLRRVKKIFVHTFLHTGFVRLLSVCVRHCTALSLHTNFNPLNTELNPICHLLALLGVHHFLHVSRIRVKSLTFRLVMSYIYTEHLFLMFLDHTQRRTTVGRTPLDE